MRRCTTLLWGLLLLLVVDAHELRIPAYVNRALNRTVIRVIPSDGFVIRVRKPDQSRNRPNSLRDSSVTRIQPVLLPPKPVPRVSLDDVLRQMGLQRMSTLMRTAQLSPFLQEAGSLTLFAPTDEAFSLMSPPTDQKRLRDFLLQHVVKGRILPEDVRNDVTIPSLRSGATPLRFNVYEDGQMLSVSGSQFLDDGRDAGSVRIQPIDRVLYPISTEDLANEARMTFPRMYELLLKTSLTPQLDSGTFTLFAPTDQAYEALTTEVRQKLMHNTTLLRKVLLNHVVPGSHYSAVLAHGYALRSLGGEPIHFTNRRGLILANGIPVVKSDISVSNGVIHALNRLLLPPELHTRRRPATAAPHARPSTIRPPPRHDIHMPVTTYIEPPPPVPRTLTKTMAVPLQLPDGRRETFSTANSLFRRSLLLSTLRNNGKDASYTILMPTDNAFGAMDQETLDRMRRNTRLLRRMLQCQMVEGKLNLTALQDHRDRPVRSLGGTLIISSLDGGKSFMAGGARVLSVRPAANGMVLVTDRVSFPPPVRSVAEALAPLQAFKGLMEKQPKIQQTLSSAEAAYTVFAPSDAALTSLTPKELQDSNFINELFWSHVVEGAYYKSRLSPGLQLTTLRGNIISIQRTQSGGLLVNNMPVTGEEILAGNGVIHRVDGILFTPPRQLAPTIAPSTASPEEDGLDKIAKEFNATQFLDWMNKANMRGILQTLAGRTGGCTLFLPTNSALRKMSPTLRVATLGDLQRLQKFVGFHVSPQVLSWNSVRDNSLMPSLLPGKQIRCNIYAKDRMPGLLTVSGCRVSAVRPLSPDANITVAVIDEAMAAPVGNLELTASKSPLLTNFSKILKVAGAEEIFSDGGPYTLFAPNACAFEKMGPDEYQRLITNKKYAREFVKRHLVRGCIYSSGLRDGQALVTEAGTKLSIQVTPECIIVSGAKLLYGDMSSTNGVLQVLDNLLTP